MRRTAGGVHPLREGHQHVVLRVVHHARDAEPVVDRLATAMPPTPTAAVAVDVGEGRCGAVARVATGRREGGVPVRALRPRDHAEVGEAAPRRRGIRRCGREEADQRQGGVAEGLAGRVEAAGAVELLGVAEGVELGLARRGDRLGGRAVACRPPQRRTISASQRGGWGVWVRAAPPRWLAVKTTVVEKGADAAASPAACSSHIVAAPPRPAASAPNPASREPGGSGSAELQGRHQQSATVRASA